MKMDICSHCRVEDPRLEEQQVSTCAIPDNPRDSVRYLSTIRRVNVTLQQTQVKDRRIQKTRKLLHDALGGLIQEKPYDEIAVQEILDRANVGRSTFYMHFRDKDELLLSSIRDMLGSVDATPLPSSGKPHERIVNFSLPI